MPEREMKPIGGELNFLANIFYVLLLGFMAQSDVVFRCLFGPLYPGGFGLALIGLPMFFLGLVNQPNTMLGSPIPLVLLIFLNLALLSKHTRESRAAEAQGELRHPKSNGQSQLGKFEWLAPWLWIVCGATSIGCFNVPLGSYMVFTGICSMAADGIGKQYARQRRHAFLAAYCESKAAMAPIRSYAHAA